jgi:hypothetical protein
VCRSSHCDVASVRDLFHFKQGIRCRLLALRCGNRPAVDRWKFWVLRFRLMVKRGPWKRPQASEGEARAMDHFAGLDVSIKEASVCVVDDTGRIAREEKVASEPEYLLQVLNNPTLYSNGSDWKPGRRRNGIHSKCDLTQVTCNQALLNLPIIANRGAANLLTQSRGRCSQRLFCQPGNRAPEKDWASRPI